MIGGFYFQKNRSENTAKVPVIGASFGQIYAGIGTFLADCYFEQIFLAEFQPSTNIVRTSVNSSLMYFAGFL